MSGRQVIPGDLADIPPGPRLSGVLSGIDLARLSGFDCVEVLKARYRQVNHERAQLMAAMVEVRATEYSFDVPAEVVGGVVPMRFTNTGGLPHEFAFARIEEGRGSWTFSALRADLPRLLDLVVIGEP